MIYEWNEVFINIKIPVLLGNFLLQGIIYQLKFRKFKKETKSKYYDIYLESKPKLAIFNLDDSWHFEKYLFFKGYLKTKDASYIKMARKMIFHSRLFLFSLILFSGAFFYYIFHLKMDERISEPVKNEALFSEVDSFESLFYCFFIWLFFLFSFLILMFFIKNNHLKKKLFPFFVFSSANATLLNFYLLSFDIKTLLITAFLNLLVSIYILKKTIICINCGKFNLKESLIKKTKKCSKCGQALS